ncbi:MAG: PAS domain S-box protein [Magnetococcales bacterium]|nr:PAS domain S-box protein [Magnetococcales bacterium]
MIKSGWLGTPRGRGRMGGGFFLLVALLALMGGFALVQMDRLASHASKLYHHPFTVSTSALTLQITFLRIHHRLSEWTYGAALPEASGLEELARWEEEALENLRVIQSRYLGDPRQMEEILHLFVAWRPQRGELLELIGQGRRTEAGVFFQEREIPLIQRLEQLTAAIVAFGRDKAEEFRFQAEVARRRTLMASGGFVLFAVLLGGLVSWLLFRRAADALDGERQAQRDFRENALFLKNILETPADFSIVATDADRMVRYFNPAAERLFGYAAEQVVGQTVEEIHAWRRVDPERFRQGLQEMNAAREYRFEMNLEDGGGERRIVESHASAMFDANGGRVGYLMLSRDVTEKKRSESELMRSENKYRSLIEAANDAILLADADTGLLVDANPKAEALLQRPVEELIGLPMTVLHPPEEADRYRQIFQEHVRSGGTKAVVAEVIRPNGERVAVEIRAGITDLGSYRLIQGIFRDVTSRRQMEQALQQALDEALDSQSLLQSILDRSSALISLKSLEGRYQLVNRSFGRLLGHAHGEILGRFDADLFPADLAEQFVKNDRAALEKGGVEVEEVAPQEDGLHTYLSVKFPLSDASGTPYAVASIATDITERKRAEMTLKNLNQILEKQVEVRTQELERSNQDLQQFAYVASHDLQEPLRQVSGFAQLLKRRYQGQLDQKADQFIDFTVEGCQRMQDLINSLLSYSRVGTEVLSPQPVEGEAVLQRALNNLQTALRESGAVVTHDPLPVLWGDGEQLVQLLQNLIGNAIKFHRPDAPPRIHVSALRREDFWTVSVRDEGIGVAPQHLGRIFDIFQRLHSRASYPGAGIGLAICKRIVERRNGWIQVKSEPGKGSVFTFGLPVYPGS